MSDSHQNLLPHDHAEAEWSYGSICDGTLPDSASGTVLDPDLELWLI
jgi:hypothetical protein